MKESPGGRGKENALGALYQLGHRRDCDDLSGPKSRPTDIDHRAPGGEGHSEIRATSP